MDREEQIKDEALIRYPTHHPFLDIAKDCFIEGAKWADKTMLIKAREWVKNIFVGTVSEDLANNIADEFVKAMEE